MLEKYREKLKEKNLKLLIGILIILIIIFLLVAVVVRDHTVRYDLVHGINMRVPDANLKNGATEIKRPTISDNSIEFQFMLPNDDSEISYQVKIKNEGETKRILHDLVVELLNNPDIDFKIEGIDGNTILEPGEEKLINITFKNKEKGSKIVNKVVLNYSMSDVINGGGGKVGVKTSTENGAKENKTPIVTKDGVKFEFVLPKSDSKIKYTVALKNNSNSSKTIDELIIGNLNNPNIEYEIIGANKGDVLKPGEEKNIEIIFKNKGEGSSEVINVDFTYSLKDVYVITYNLNGGNLDIKYQKKEKGQVVTLNNNAPVKEGYIFKGYSNGLSSEVTYKPGDKYSEDADLTLYAVWDSIKYTISYDGNGNTTGTMNNSSHKYGVQSKLNKNSYVKKGYIFVGWSTIKNGTVVYEDAADIMNLTKEDNAVITLYAAWKKQTYLLDVRLNGGSLNGLENIKQELAYEEQYLLGTPVKVGYTFINYDVEIGNIVNKVSGNSFITMFDSNIIASANYEPNIYEIKLYNDADVKGTQTLYEVYEKGIYKNQRYVDTMNSKNHPIDVPSKDGYLFKGYYAVINDEEVKLIDKNGYITKNFDSTLFTNTALIYAKWGSETLEITLDNQNANNTPTSSIYVKYNENFYLDSKKVNQMSTESNPVVIPTKVGYTFRGYYERPNGEGERLINENGFVDTTKNTLFYEDATVYAYYSENVYELTLDDTQNKIYVKYNAGIYSDENLTNSMSNTSNPVGVVFNEGYIFKGYYERPNGEGKLMIDRNGYITSNVTNRAFTENQTLYSYRTPITYEIRYMANGATSGEMSPSNYTYDRQSKLRRNSFERLGYTFKGWSLNGNDTVDYEDEADILNITTTNFDVITLHAVWEIKSYGLTVNLNGGTTTQEFPENPDYNSTIELITPIKTGYTFKEWEVQGNGSIINGNVLTVGNEGVVLTAKWTVNVYKIKLDNKDATNNGTRKIYEKYGKGIYLDEDCNNLMETNANSIEVPEKTGYTFGGYYTEENGLGEQLITVDGNITNVFVNTIFLSDTTIYAKWTINQYTLTVDLKGGTTTQEFSTTVNYSDRIELIEPTRKGATFDRWVVEGHGSRIEDNVLTIGDGDVNLTAKWTINVYEISLDNIEATNKGTKKIYERYGRGIYLDEAGNDDLMETNSNPIEVPVKSGYTFGGYYTELDGSGEKLITEEGYITDAFIDTKFPGNATIYAKWTINQYTLTVDLNGGTTTQEFPTTVDYGTEIDLVEPTKQGYTFKKWIVDGSTIKNNKLKIGPSDTELVAKWTTNEYTVTFKKENGEEDEVQTKKYNEKISAPTEPTKTGYAFAHWSLTENGEKYDLNTPVTEDITLYAVFANETYDVTFKKENGEEDEVQTINYKGNITIPQIPTKEFCTFSHWSLTENGEIYDITIPVTKDTTLYAVYTVNKYEVIFYDKGEQISNEVIEAGTLLTPPIVTKKTGYEFSHWSETIDGPEYNMLLPLERKLILFSVYEPEVYDIEFYDNDEKIKTEKVSYNNRINKTNIPVPAEREGFNFVDWYKQDETESFDPDTLITENIKLYSKFEKISNKVKFIYNNGSNETEVSVEYGDTVLQPTNPSKVGATFSHWSTKIDGTDTYDFSTPVKGTITLYAIYIPDKQTVRFMFEGEPYGIAQIVDNGSTINEPEHPEKTGYTFTHWSLTENGSYYDPATPVTSDITLYAVLRINTYNLTINYNNGTDTAIVPITYQATKNIPAPERTGWTFTEWTLTGEGSSMTSLTEDATFTMGYEDATLTANYIANKYTVSLDNQEAIVAGQTVVYEEYETGIYLDNSYDESKKMSLTENSIEVPQKTGYTFRGYYTEVNGGGLQLINENGYITDKFTNTKFLEDTTLYAKWTINSYPLTTNYNNGISALVDTLNYHATKEISKPTKTGYTFTEWTLTGEGSSMTSLTEDATFTMGYEAATLTANYIANKYTVSLDNQDATTAGQTAIYEEYETGIYLDNSYDESKKMSTVSNSIEKPEKTGYTFEGYYTETNGRGTQLINENGYITDEFTNIIFLQDKTLYAKWTINQYTLTTTLNNGVADTIDTLNYNATKEINIPSKTGYTFTGWTLTGEGSSITEYTVGDIKATFTMGHEDATLTANYDANKYTVSLDNQSATSAGQTAVYEEYETGIYLDDTYTDAKEMTTLTNSITKPEKTGYTFGGYYTEANGSGLQLIDANGYITDKFTNTKFLEDTTLYAKWTINSYVLTINYNNGTSALVDTLNYKATKSITRPSKTGYAFTGWTLTGEGSEMTSLTEDATFTMGYEAATLTANYDANKYEITLDNQEATSAGTETVYEEYETGIYVDDSYSDSKKMTSSANPIIKPEKTGHTFGGYYTEEDGGGIQLIDANGYITDKFTNTKFLENTTLYAKWTRNSYSLTIDYNNGTSATIDTLYYQATREVNNPSKDGYTFNGWTVTGAGSSMIGTTFTMGYETATLTANYDAITYSVKYDGNNSTSGEMSNSTHTYDVAKDLTTNTYRRNGYTFKGWATSSSATTVTYTDGVSVTNLSNTNGAVVTLYAVWEKNSYDLYVDPNGCTWNSQTTKHKYATVEYKGTKTIATPTCTNYTFSSWAVSPSDKESSIEETTFTMGYAETTLTANKNPKTYTITLDNQTATTAGTTSVYSVYNTGIYLDSEKTKKMATNANAITVPTKTGYVFEGYYTATSGGTQFINSTGYITSSFTTTNFNDSTSTLKLYARWTRITASDLTYIDNAGLGCNNVQCAIDKLSEKIGN